MVIVEYSIYQNQYSTYFVNVIKLNFKLSLSAEKNGKVLSAFVMRGRWWIKHVISKIKTSGRLLKFFDLRVENLFYILRYNSSRVYHITRPNFGDVAILFRRTIRCEL